VTAADSLAAALSDRYAIERELGQGGMATVYLARDLRHERHVAVKVLRPELAASLGSERFLREIKLAARLPKMALGRSSSFLPMVEAQLRSRPGTSTTGHHDGRPTAGRSRSRRLP
jgi:serine/threonine protein kinase